MRNDEWQIEKNEWGGERRYRIVDGVKEYELEVITSGGAVLPQSRLKEHHEAAQRGKPERLAAMRTETKRCLFDNGACKGGKCILYDDGCSLAELTEMRAATEGLYCPFSNEVCNTRCAVYDDGCGLAALLKKHWR